MAFETSLKTVFGFLNRSESFPTPLITLATVEGEDDVYAIYPSGDPVKIIDRSTGLPLAKEEIVMRSKFVPAAETVQAKDVMALTSFGIAADKIVVGTAQQIFEQLDIEVNDKSHTESNLQRLADAHQSWRNFITDGKSGPS